MARLVPELDVASLQYSLAFYVDELGFTLVFERPEEKFARIAREGAELMLEEAAGPGRRFRIASLEYPFGRGINLQILVPDVDVTYAAVLASDIEPVIQLENRWYDVDVVSPSGRWASTGAMKAGNRQFVVSDPDGYLLRFYTSLGAVPI